MAKSEVIQNENSRPALLIVEDDEDIREILFMAFEKKDWTVYGAANGHEALEVMNQNRVDAVMSDIKMPLMDGLQLLMAVRQRGWDTPFIFLTANGDKQSAISALRLGAMDFIEKPFQIDEVCKQVEKAVERGYLLRMAESQIDTDGLSSQDPLRNRAIIKAKKSLFVAKKQRTG